MSIKGPTKRAEKKAAKFSWSRISIRSQDECWPWDGGKNTYGYGMCVWLGKSTNASRAALESLEWFIPEGMFACHHCDNPICCNPSHLYIGSPKDNARDKVIRGRLVGVFDSGKAHPRHSAKLCEQDVLAIRAAVDSGESKFIIADRYGISYNQVRIIGLRKSWRHL
jgi:hypothetical protein